MERKGITKLNARVKELEETSKNRRSNKVSRVLGRLSQLSTPGHTVPIMVPRHQLPTRQPESESEQQRSQPSYWFTLVLHCNTVKIILMKPILGYFLFRDEFRKPVGLIGGLGGINFI